MSEARRMEIGLPKVSVLGHGFFSPRFRSIDDAFEGRRSEAEAPSFDLVEGRLRRFTSLTSQMHIEAAGRALRASGVDPSSVRGVFATAIGELHTTWGILERIGASLGTSAPRFVQSVHSTPAGLFSLATGNHRSMTTVAANDATVAAGLYDGALLLADDPSPVLVTFGDDTIPTPLVDRPFEPFACAFVLRAHRPEDSARLELRRGTEPAANDPAFDAFTNSPIAASLRIAFALTHRSDSSIATGRLFGDDSLLVDVRCA